MFFSARMWVRSVCATANVKKKRKEKKVIPLAAAAAAATCVDGTAPVAAASMCHPVHLPPPDVTPVSSHGLVRGSSVEQKEINGPAAAFKDRVCCSDRLKSLQTLQLLRAFPFVCVWVRGCWRVLVGGGLSCADYSCQPSRIVNTIHGRVCPILDLFFKEIFWMQSYICFHWFWSQNCNLCSHCTSYSPKPTTGCVEWAVCQACWFFSSLLCKSFVKADSCLEARLLNVPPSGHQEPLLQTLTATPLWPFPDGLFCLYIPMYCQSLDFINCCVKYVQLKYFNTI